MLKIGWIACGNGLGHVKRSIKIINEIIERFGEARVTLFCESWQVECLIGWKEYDIFASGNGTEIEVVEIPVRWNPDSSYYSDWLLEWHKVIAEWGLSRFDQVVSDNIVEVLFYSERATLSGSFLWHDVLADTFGGHKVIERYKRELEGLLCSVKPDMIVNQYFAMPATEQQTDAHKVGLIHFNKRVRRDVKRSGAVNVLVAIGNCEFAREGLGQIKSIMPIFEGMGAKLFCSAGCYDRLCGQYQAIEKYDFNNEQMDFIDAAIVRGGLGTISDCMAAEIPMILLDDSNPETKFNGRCLSRMGIGIWLESFLQDGGALLVDQKQYERVVERFGDFEFDGEVGAAEFLLKKWAIKE